MRFALTFPACSCFVAALFLAGTIAAQNSSPSSSSAPTPATPKSDSQTRITLDVTGGDKEMPVENASVYFKYIEERKIRKDKKLELNVKTNREGVAHVPDAPMV